MANGSGVETISQNKHELRQRIIAVDKREITISEEGQKKDQELDKHQKYVLYPLQTRKLTLHIAGSLAGPRGLLL